MPRKRSCDNRPALARAYYGIADAVMRVELLTRTCGISVLLGRGEATANAIHMRSKRASGPFVSRNAASFAMSVVDTELFGHPANFPSAGTPERKGLFGQADGGTLFFDEVADCSPEVQARLLRVLDSPCPRGSRRC
jgi:transcriptional regulator with GAF, ATPase, and Fis domain